MQVGDVVELGRHRLMCGDAFNSEHVDALMGGEKPDMLYCDPPYGMKLNTNYSSMVCDDPKHEMGRRPRLMKGGEYTPIIGDELPFTPLPLIQRFDAIPEQFWWGADYYRMTLPDGGSWIVWDKRGGNLDRAFGSCFEMCWSRKRHKRDIVRIRWQGVFGTEKEPERRRLHPTQKPILLAEWFLERYSKENALILDLFAGSGSTLLACERMNRRCFTMELSPDYCQVIIDRYHKMTAQPRLLETVA